MYDILSLIELAADCNQCGKNNQKEVFPEYFYSHEINIMLFQYDDSLHFILYSYLKLIMFFMRIDHMTGVIRLTSEKGIESGLFSAVNKLNKLFFSKERNEI
jgi:hypothetical protein